MKATKWFVIGLGVVAAARLSAAEAARPDLSGRVTGDDGTPVAKATVFVYSAGPKEGTSTVCPYCYPDCSKKAQTGADGRFRIESLDPRLRFRLLIVAGGHESKFETKVDPATGARQITLKPLSPEALHSTNRIAGLVIGEDGRPVVGAVISPQGVQRGNGTQWGGTDEFVDPVAVADDQGRFLLLCQATVETVYAEAEGPGAAQRWVELKPGRDHLIRMREGVAVAGRIQRDGQPVQDALVGLVTSDRLCGNFLRYDAIATDKDGRFALPNVTPEREFVVYVTIDSLHGHGAVPPKKFTTGPSGTTADLGALAVQPAHRIAGRVVLSDGKPVPPGTRLVLGREEAWDHAEALLDAEGRFEFQGVPAESVSLSLRIKGYKFSKRNPSLDWRNGGVLGRVDRDLTNLTLLLEPGEWRYNGDEGEPPGGREVQPRDKPLASAKL